MNDLFTDAPIPKAYFKLAMPVVISMVVSMVYNLADTFFVSHTQNADLVAGVAICTPLFSIMLALGDIFGLGGSALISKLLGQKNYELAKKISSFCFYSAIVLGLVVMAILLVFERPILNLFGTTPAIYPYAAEFYRIMSAGAVIIITSLVPLNLLRTEGLATESMVGSVVGLVVTIVLDPIFIFSFNLGAGGAALATVVGYFVTDIVLCYMVVKHCRVINMHWRLARVSKTALWQVLIIGIPASITNFMQAFGTAILNNYLAVYGAKQVAAFGIASKVYLIVMLVMIGFAFGSQPLIGFNYGAKNMQRFSKIVRFDILVEVVFAVILAGILMIFAPLVIRLFMDQATIVSAGTLLLRSLLSTTPFIGIILVFTTVFQSTGKALGALIMAISRQGIVFLVTIIVAYRLFGYMGVVFSQPIADILTCAIGFFLYRYDFKNITRPQAEA